MKDFTKKLIGETCKELNLEIPVGFDPEDLESFYTFHSNRILDPKNTPSQMLALYQEYWRCSQARLEVLEKFNQSVDDQIAATLENHAKDNSPDYTERIADLEKYVEAMTDIRATHQIRLAYTVMMGNILIFIEKLIESQST